MRCNNCGQEIDNNSKFCTKCGARIDSAKKNNKNLIIGIISLTVFVLCAALIITYCTRSWPFNNGIAKSSGLETGTIYDLNEDNIVHDEKTGIDYVNNIIVIYCKDGTTSKEVKDIAKLVNGKIVGSMPDIDQYQIEIPASSYEELNAYCTKLETNENIDFAGIDTAIKLEPQEIPNDPWSGAIWDEENPEGFNWWAEAIELPSAWEYSGLLKKKTAIGVVDAGIDINHEDIGNIVKSVGKYNDANEHGTHVTGIIGAKVNNVKGISGVVKDAEIYSQDVFLTDQQKNETQLYNWSSTTNICNMVADLIMSKSSQLDKRMVVNVSIGRVINYISDINSINIDVMGKEASKCLLKVLEKGYDFVIVQSAGNGTEEDDCAFDAKYNGIFCSINYDNCVYSENISSSDIIDRIIVVGAANEPKNGTYEQPYWSNGGDRVDICAPGSNIYSTGPNNSYIRMNGTSMAAPMVTGTASLVWSADPTLSGSEVKEIICNGANSKSMVYGIYTEKHKFHDTFYLLDTKLCLEDALNIRKELNENELIKIIDNLCEASSYIENNGAIEGDYYSPITIDGKKYYPIRKYFVDGEQMSMNEIMNLYEKVFTDEAIEEILSDNQYIEYKGKVYSPFECPPFGVTSPFIINNITATKIPGKDEYKISYHYYHYKDFDGEKYIGPIKEYNNEFSSSLVNENGKWLLNGKEYIFFGLVFDENCEYVVN